jgi:hypothetical protein
VKAFATMVVLLLVVAGCGGKSSSSPRKSALADLQSVDQLRTLFNVHAGEPRLILLMSPT